MFHGLVSYELRVILVYTTHVVESHRDYSGLFLVNEGTDGSGKETQSKILEARLKKEGFDVFSIDFPTYGRDPVADFIKWLLKYMKDEWNNRSWQSRALLYASNRAKFLPQIKNALSAGKVVLCDRWTPSTQAFMAGDENDTEKWEEHFSWIEQLEYEVLGLPKPDLVILHTMPSSFRESSLKKRELDVPDGHEENTPYLDRVEQCYHALKEREKEIWSHVPADVGGEIQLPEAVHERVWQTLTAHSAWQEYAGSRQFSEQEPALKKEMFL